MKGDRVTDDQVKAIQLEMLDEIDSFCRNHDIRYSLAFGTLLGAIRHKGYIPWDDDVDIIMPLPDMLRFKKEFNSDRLVYCDLDTVPHYENHFSRIAYLPTYSKHGLVERSYGVSIDLYPVVGMPDSEEEIEGFLNGIQPLYKKRMNMLAWRKRITRRLPVCSIPFFKHVVGKFRDKILYSYKYEGAHNFLHAGSVRRINIVDFNVFDSLVDVPFEGHTYLAVGEWDRYLTHMFGEYMQFPPEDQRHPYHGFVYYWK